jgi:hypothetical protein
MNHTVYYICGTNSITPVTKTCRRCRVITPFILDTTRYQVWQSGQLIQSVFPDMDPEDRETLITGICPECWDKICSA